MRVVTATLMLLMILFIAVQYNDPDGKIWMAIYAIPAIWAAIATIHRPLLRNRFATGLLILTSLSAALGLVCFWPDTPGWWQQDIWWETETAREGMGMMVIAIVLMLIWLSRQTMKLTTDDRQSP